MAKRETFTSPVECTGCGKAGRVTWEENENPVYAGGSERDLIDVPVGFRRGNGKDASGDPEIVCDTCGTAV
ncbi:hypothetical protein PO883_31725 [Massilia sp. DJPM01]|uniref:hypothetical protein n=1 Tax=Massilia sp. DJPM01 TaxID=3024404 RepID=UPI00259F434A|nr:hypothetical protein [Massilia sp. DJPM01]MDM5181752.1 hypothetical protein [Massilia sp. DJPM01]